MKYDLYYTSVLYPMPEDKYPYCTGSKQDIRLYFRRNGELNRHQVSRLLNEGIYKFPTGSKYELREVKQ